MRRFKKNCVIWRLCGAPIVLADVEEHLVAKIKPEQKVKLTNSIKNHLEFREKGGDLDFSTPVIEIVEDDDFDKAQAAIILDVVRLIEGAREAK